MKDCCRIVSTATAARVVKQLLLAAASPSRVERALGEVGDEYKLLNAGSTADVAELLGVSPDREMSFLGAIEKAGYTSPVVGVELVVKTELVQLADDGWGRYWLVLRRTHPVDPDGQLVEHL